jgi:hypothetical protein
MGSCTGAWDGLPRYRSGIRIANPAFARSMCHWPAGTTVSIRGFHAPTRRFIAAVIAAAIMISAPGFTSTASAQPAYGTSTNVRLVAVLVGAAAGATVAVLLWPAAAPAAAVAAPSAWSAFLSTQAAIGALIGGALGYFEFGGALGYFEFRRQGATPSSRRQELALGEKPERDRRAQDAERDAKQDVTAIGLGAEHGSHPRVE